MKRRLLSILTVLTLCVSMVPFGAGAVGEDGSLLGVEDITSEEFEGYTFVGDASDGLDLSTLPTVDSLWTVQPIEGTTHGGIITYDAIRNILTFKGVQHINGSIAVGKGTSSLTVWLDGLVLPDGEKTSNSIVVDNTHETGDAIKIDGDVTIESIEEGYQGVNIDIHSNGIGILCTGHMTIKDCIITSDSHKTDGLKAGIVVEEGLNIESATLGSNGYRENDRHGTREPEYEEIGGSVQVTSGNLVIENGSLHTTTTRILNGGYSQTGSCDVDMHWMQLTGDYNASYEGYTSLLVEKYTQDTQYNRTSEEFTVFGEVVVNEKFAEDLQEEMALCENVSFTTSESARLCVKNPAVLSLALPAEKVDLSQGSVDVGGTLALADGYDLTKIGQLRTQYDYYKEELSENGDQVVGTYVSENGTLRVGNTDYYSVNFQANMTDELGSTIPGFGNSDQAGTEKWYYDIKTQLVASGEKAVEPVIPEGSEIKGWYEEGELQTKWDFASPITETLTLYGEWLKVGQYTVTFHTNGGSAVENQTLYLGQLIEKVEPTRSGYVFDGWYTDEAFEKLWDFNERITGDMDMYARWTYTSSGSSGGSSSRPSNPTTPTTPENPTTPTTPENVTATPDATVSTDGSAASAEVTAAMGSDLVKQAVENKSEEIIISPNIDSDVSKTEVTVPASALTDIASKTDAALTVKTPVAQVTIPNEALGALAKDGGSVTVTAEKTDNGYQLSVTANGQTVDSVNGGVTMTVPYTDCVPGTVAVLVKEDGTREIIRKSLAGEDSVTVPLDGSARIELVDNSKSFQDVTDSSWEKDAVDFVSSHELFNGTSEDTFAPESSMTRGMVAQVLHNLEGNPAQSISGVFTDVDGNVWYAEAVSWAADKGIVSGYGDGQFGAGDSVSRQDLAVILFRYSGSPDSTAQTLNFTDAGEISDYARQALSWAVEEGILNGKGNGVLDPKGQATRAQVAQMLLNYMSAVQ